MKKIENKIKESIQLPKLDFYHKLPKVQSSKKTYIPLSIIITSLITFIVLIPLFNIKKEYPSKDSIKINSIKYIAETQDSTTLFEKVENRKTITEKEIKEKYHIHLVPSLKEINIQTSTEVINIKNDIDITMFINSHSNLLIPSIENPKYSIINGKEILIMHDNGNYYIYYEKNNQYLLTWEGSLTNLTEYLKEEMK